MKKTLLTALSGLALSFGYAQTTATNFTATDCASISHTLFTELDAGKVIVITWPMPCGTCIAPAKTAANTVLAMADPNILFYLVDDVGNSSCSTLSSWASTNSITANAKFGNAGNNIKMTDYGSSGMPKTIVIGGLSHTVYYNVNGTVSQSALQTAINNGLNAMTGITNPIHISSYNVLPNPADQSTSVTFSLESASDVNISIYNMIGENVKSIFTGARAAGENKVGVDCSGLNNGLYFVKLSADKLEKTLMLSVTH